MLRNVSISLEPPSYVTDSKATRFITINIQADGYPEFKRVEIINENDFQDVFSIVMYKIKREVLKEYKKYKNSKKYREE